MAVLKVLASDRPAMHADGPAHCEHPWPLEVGQVRFQLGVYLPRYITPEGVKELTPLWYEMRPALGNIMLRRF